MASEMEMTRATMQEAEMVMEVIKPFETIWNYLKLFETIWNYLKLFETIWKNHWTKSGHKLIVLEVVNRAYKVELGNEGVAFKSGDRSFVKIAEMFH